jgi:hypothetical protein
VLTAGSASEIEFPKVAECVLFVPPPPTKTTLALLDIVREHSLAFDFIDPTKQAGQSRNRPPSLRGAGSSGKWDLFFGNPVPAWATSIASILNTPRRIKSTVSAISSRWDALVGEVDFDELIMLTVLRLCSPAVFSFLGVHFQEFKGFRPPHGKENPDDHARMEERREYLKTRWLRAVTESGFDSHLLGTVLAELVPSSAYITGVAQMGHGNRCQSITSSRGDVYWERLTTETLSDGAVRDQEVLQLIRGATSDEGITLLANRFAESMEVAELVLFFDKWSRAVDDAALLKIATVVIRKSRPLVRRRLNRETTSLWALREWMEKLSYADTALRDWLVVEMEHCLPHSLADANTLFMDFGRSKLDQDAMISVRTRFVNALREVLSTISPLEFARMFDADYPYSLGQLIRLDGKTYPEPLLTDAKSWQWLRGMLLDAMTHAPELAIPQVMMLFGTFGPGGHYPTWFKYDEMAMLDLFGEELRRAVALLSQDFAISSSAEPWFQLAGPLGTKQARNWLKQMDSDSVPVAPGAKDLGEIPYEISQSTTA